MLKRLGFWIAICVVTFAHIVSAQTDVVDTFPVEQRCISEPTQPPDGWTYPGMILMSGYAGIHAMQADWETPHVVAQFTMDQQGNVPIDGGQLSPDGNWYASPIGEVFTSESFNSFWLVYELSVYSLSGDGMIFTLDLRNYQEALSGWSAFGFSPITWQDNQSLTIGELLIHPFEPAITDSKVSTSDYFLAPRVISPDFTRMYEGYYNSSDFNLYDTTTSTGLANIGALKHISWRRDSSGFIGEMQEENQNWHGIAYFDRSGKLDANVLQFDAYSYDVGRPMSGRSELQWSLDDRYFAFAINSDNGTRELYVVDMQTGTVMDTCLTSLTQPIWSPDGTLFAYLTDAPENLKLVVVDTTTWQAYDVARHSGYPAYFNYYPEMVGWRSTTEAQ